MNDLDTVNAIRNAKSAVEAIRILRKHTEGLREEAVAEEHNRVIKTIVEEWKLEGSELTRLVIALTPPTN
jgi:hypothetical protein